MKPIAIRITAASAKTSLELCADFLDTSRWPEFTGYGFLPGVKRAEFEIRTPGLVGSRIRVQNTDGSSHVEEIIEWDPARRIAVRFGEFQPPLSRLAAHFIETWEFRETATGTEIVRSMEMYPKGFFGRLVLLPISILMKKAFEQQFARMEDHSRRELKRSAGVQRSSGADS